MELTVKKVKGKVTIFGDDRKLGHFQETPDDFELQTWLDIFSGKIGQVAPRSPLEWSAGIRERNRIMKVAKINPYSWDNLDQENNDDIEEDLEDDIEE